MAYDTNKKITQIQTLKFLKLFISHAYREHFFFAAISWQWHISCPAAFGGTPRAPLHFLTLTYPGKEPGAVGSAGGSCKLSLLAWHIAGQWHISWHWHFVVA